ncbi:hypothetical protein [Pseudidiomarina sp. YC-516-91]|uniref:hypothetical protein n=1 Tax=Pseudidiomarina salilacus TaxID=3384452 RepID=UPI0039855188
MKIWQQTPLSVKVIGAIAVLLCLYDFSNRVWVTTEVNQRETTSFDAGAHSTAAPQVAQDVQDYIRQLATATASETANDDTESANRTPLIEGGVNVGEMRVRVRAIYTAPGTERRTALIEAQHIEQRSLELTEVNEGFELNNYKVSAITVDSVIFTGADPNERIAIPVFDY